MVREKLFLHCAFCAPFTKYACMLLIEGLDSHTRIGKYIKYMNLCVLLYNCVLYIYFNCSSLISSLSMPTHHRSLPFIYDVYLIYHWICAYFFFITHMQLHVYPMYVNVAMLIVLSWNCTLIFPFFISLHFAFNLIH